jgi:hypothetical protein
LFAVVATAATIAPDDVARPAAVVDGALFLVGVVAFLWAYGTAVARSRTLTIGIGGLYFLSGSAPTDVRRRLLGALALQVVVAVVTAAVRPYTAVAFGILVPVFGLGLAGLWGARHGSFPPRVDDPARRLGRDADGGSDRAGGRVGPEPEAGPGPRDDGGADRDGQVDADVDG